MIFSQLIRILRTLYSYNIYENTIIHKNIENREVYCMDLTTQLMPDLTTDIMYQIHRQNDLHPKNHKVKEIFDVLKKKLVESIDESKINRTVKDIFQNRLKKINLRILSAGKAKDLQNIYEQLDIITDNYQENVLKMLKHFRRTIYSLTNTKVSPATL